MLFPAHRERRIFNYRPAPGRLTAMSAWARRCTTCAAAGAFHADTVHVSGTLRSLHSLPRELGSDEKAPPGCTTA